MEVWNGADRDVRRPMNAFLIFCKKHRRIVREKNPKLDNRSVTRILGEMWAELVPEEKVVYTELANQYKEAFLKANPDYKWHGTDKPTIPNPRTCLQYNPVSVKQTPPSETITLGKLADPTEMGGLTQLLSTDVQSQTSLPQNLPQATESTSDPTPITPQPITQYSHKTVSNTAPNVPLWSSWKVGQAMKLGHRIVKPVAIKYTESSAVIGNKTPVPILSKDSYNISKIHPTKVLTVEKTPVVPVTSGAVMSGYNLIPTQNPTKTSQPKYSISSRYLYPNMTQNLSTMAQSKATLNSSYELANQIPRNKDGSVMDDVIGRQFEPGIHPSNKDVGKAETDTFIASTVPANESVRTKHPNESSVLIGSAVNQSQDAPVAQTSGPDYNIMNSALMQLAEMCSNELRLTNETAVTSSQTELPNNRIQNSTAVIDEPTHSKPKSRKIDRNFDDATSKNKVSVQSVKNTEKNPDNLSDYSDYKRSPKSGKSTKTERKAAKNSPKKVITSGQMLVDSIIDRLFYAEREQSKLSEPPNGKIPGQFLDGNLPGGIGDVNARLVPPNGNVDNNDSRFQMDDEKLSVKTHGSNVRKISEVIRDEGYVSSGNLPTSVGILPISSGNATSSGILPISSGNATSSGNLPTTSGNIATVRVNLSKSIGNLPMQSGNIPSSGQFVYEKSENFPDSGGFSVYTATEKTPNFHAPKRKLHEFLNQKSNPDLSKENENHFSVMEQYNCQKSQQKINLDRPTPQTDVNVTSHNTFNSSYTDFLYWHGQTYCRDVINHNGRYMKSTETYIPPVKDDDLTKHNTTKDNKIDYVQPVNNMDKLSSNIIDQSTNPSRVTVDSIGRRTISVSENRSLSWMSDKMKPPKKRHYSETVVEDYDKIDVHKPLRSNSGVESVANPPHEVNQFSESSKLYNSGSTQTKNMTNNINTMLDIDKTRLNTNSANKLNTETLNENNNFVDYKNSTANKVEPSVQTCENNKNMRVSYQISANSSVVSGETNIPKEIQNREIKTLETPEYYTSNTIPTKDDDIIRKNIDSSSTINVPVSTQKHHTKIKDTTSVKYQNKKSNIDSNAAKNDDSLNNNNNTLETKTHKKILDSDSSNQKTDIDAIITNSCDSKVKNSVLQNDPISTKITNSTETKNDPPQSCITNTKTETKNAAPQSCITNTKTETKNAAPQNDATTTITNTTSVPPTITRDDRVRKSKRRNRGQRYLELINEGIIHPSKERLAALRTESCSDVDKELEDAPDTTKPLTPEPCISPSKSKQERRYVTGGFDLEAHIATLPPCSMYSLNKRRGRGARPSPDGSPLKGAKALPTQEPAVSTAPPSIAPPPPIPSDPTVTAEYLGSRKRKIRRHAINHLTSLHEATGTERETTTTIPCQSSSITMDTTTVTMTTHSNSDNNTQPGYSVSEVGHGHLTDKVDSFGDKQICETTMLSQVNNINANETSLAANPIVVTNKNSLNKTLKSATKMNSDGTIQNSENVRNPSKKKHKKAKATSKMINDKVIDSRMEKSTNSSDVICTVQSNLSNTNDDVIVSRSINVTTFSDISTPNSNSGTSQTGTSQAGTSKAGTSKAGTSKADIRTAKKKDKLTRKHATKKITTSEIVTKIPVIPEDVAKPSITSNISTSPVSDNIAIPNNSASTISIAVIKSNMKDNSALSDSASSSEITLQNPTKTISQNLPISYFAVTSNLTNPTKTNSQNLPISHFAATPNLTNPTSNTLINPTPLNPPPNPTNPTPTLSTNPTPITPTNTKLLDKLFRENLYDQPTTTGQPTSIFTQNTNTIEKITLTTSQYLSNFTSRQSPTQFTLSGVNQRSLPSSYKITETSNMNVSSSTYPQSSYKITETSNMYISSTTYPQSLFSVANSPNQYPVSFSLQNPTLPNLTYQRYQVDDTNIHNTKNVDNTQSYRDSTANNSDGNSTKIHRSKLLNLLNKKVTDNVITTGITTERLIHEKIDSQFVNSHNITYTYVPFQSVNSSNIYTTSINRVGQNSNVNFDNSYPIQTSVNVSNDRVSKSGCIGAEIVDSSYKPGQYVLDSKLGQTSASGPMNLGQTCETKIGCTDPSSKVGPYGDGRLNSAVTTSQSYVGQMNLLQRNMDQSDVGRDSRNLGHTDTMPSVDQTNPVTTKSHSKTKSPNKGHKNRKLRKELFGTVSPKGKKKSTANTDITQNLHALKSLPETSQITTREMTQITTEQIPKISTLESLKPTTLTYPSAIQATAMLENTCAKTSPSKHPTYVSASNTQTTEMLENTFAKTPASKYPTYVSASNVQTTDMLVNVPAKTTPSKHPTYVSASIVQDMLENTFAKTTPKYPTYVSASNVQTTDMLVNVPAKTSPSKYPTYVSASNVQTTEMLENVPAKTTPSKHLTYASASNIQTMEMLENTFAKTPSSKYPTYPSPSSIQTPTLANTSAKTASQTNITINQPNAPKLPSVQSNAPPNYEDYRSVFNAAINDAIDKVLISENFPSDKQENLLLNICESPLTVKRDNSDNSDKCTTRNELSYTSESVVPQKCDNLSQADKLQQTSEIIPKQSG